MKVSDVIKNATTFLELNSILKNAETHYSYFWGRYITIKEYEGYERISTLFEKTCKLNGLVNRENVTENDIQGAYVLLKTLNKICKLSASQQTPWSGDPIVLWKKSPDVDGENSSIGTREEWHPNRGDLWYLKIKHPISKAIRKDIEDEIKAEYGPNGRPSIFSSRRREIEKHVKLKYKMMENNQLVET